MEWSIEFLDDRVRDEVAALPKDMRAALFRLSERIEAVGLEAIGQPHVKHLRGKLWEMRFSGRDGIGRAIYMTLVGRRIVIVHAFMKKTQSTPDSVLRLAERRAKDVK